MSCGALGLRLIADVRQEILRIRHLKIDAQVPQSSFCAAPPRHSAPQGESVEADRGGNAECHSDAFTLAAGLGRLHRPGRFRGRPAGVPAAAWVVLFAGRRNIFAGPDSEHSRLILLHAALLHAAILLHAAGRHRQDHPGVPAS